MQVPLTTSSSKSNFRFPSSSIISFMKLITLFPNILLASDAPRIAAMVMERLEVKDLLGEQVPHVKNFTFTTGLGEYWTKEKVDSALFEKTPTGVNMKSSSVSTSFWASYEMLNSDAIDGFAYIARRMRWEK